MFSALSDATDRLDPKQLVAYWLPALVATFAGVGILALLVGPPLLDAWINDLDGFDQLGFGLLLLGITAILALFFKAMRRPILHAFGGDLLPPAVADWAMRREQQSSFPAAMPQADADPGADASLRQWRAMLDRAVPIETQHLRPTRFGNMLANLEDHTAIVHGMDYRIWWPRLAPLLPQTMRDIAASETASMTGLLNLSLVWGATALVGAAMLGPIGGRWGAAAAVLLGGILLSWVSYRAAIREGEEAGRHIHAAFDLYRHEILKHLALEIPADAAAERALWERLTAEMVHRVIPLPGAAAAEQPAPPPRSHGKVVDR